MVGIADYDYPGFSIFPLPNTGDFFVKNSNGDNNYLQIFSLSGQFCAQYPLNQATTAIPAQLASDTYQWHVLDKQGKALNVKKRVVL